MSLKNLSEFNKVVTGRSPVDGASLDTEFYDKYIWFSHFCLNPTFMITVVCVGVHLDFFVRPIYLLYGTCFAFFPGYRRVNIYWICTTIDLANDITCTSYFHVHCHWRLKYLSGVPFWFQKFTHTESLGILHCSTFFNFLKLSEIKLRDLLCIFYAETNNGLRFSPLCCSY